MHRIIRNFFLYRYKRKQTFITMTSKETIIVLFMLVITAIVAEGNNLQDCINNCDTERHLRCTEQSVNVMEHYFCVRIAKICKKTCRLTVWTNEADKNTIWNEKCIETSPTEKLAGRRSIKLMILDWQLILEEKFATFQHRKIIR